MENNVFIFFKIRGFCVRAFCLMPVQLHSNISVRIVGYERENEEKI